MKPIYTLFILLALCFHAVLAQVPVPVFTNAAYQVFSPKISSDGSSMVYASNINGTMELFLCKNQGTKENPLWGVPETLIFEGGSLGIGVQLSHPCLNATGDVLFFTSVLQENLGGTDIYFSRWTNGKWQQPQNIANVNSMFDEEAPMISVDNRYLFFSRKHPGEKSGEFVSKIYYAKRLEDGNWGVPVLLPSNINSADENYPFLSADNKLMFFASRRKNDLDGYNLYVSKRFAENLWGDPEPLPGVNTDYDDVSPSLAVNSQSIYYNQLQFKKKEWLGAAYQLSVPEQYKVNPVFEFEGKVLDKNSQIPLDASILLRYTDTREQFLSLATTMPDGAYRFYLTPGREFEMEVFCPYYSHQFLTFDAGFKTTIPKEPVINHFELFNQVVLILNVFDREIFEPLQGSIKFLDEASPGAVNYLGNGRYQIELNVGKHHELEILVPNYEPYVFTFDLSSAILFNEFERDVELEPSKTQFEINIADMETDEAINEVEIVITNLEKNETIVKKVRKDENGKFVVDLRAGDKYEIDVNGPKGYAFYNTKVDMSDTENKKLDVKLKPLKAKTKLVLNDITFETNSADLNTSSYEELDRVIKLLIDNPDIKIEISAHSDNVGSDAYNMKLSSKRAQSVVDYLISGQLPLERLIAKGYGESMPIASNDTEENRAKNRRVELKIIDVNENENPQENE
jgi:outer membrane protein OmpA-like peptidoglycan-associated protein